MKIVWFDRDKDGSSIIFESNGDAPAVGGTVYVNDWRGGSVKIARYTVVGISRNIRIDHSRELKEYDTNDTGDPASRLSAICDSIEKETGGLVFKLSDSGHHAVYSTDEIQVTICKVKDE